MTGGDAITIRRESGGEEYTAALAAGFAALLAPGDVIALEGDLGAGKTTFVRAVAAALGVRTGAVSSPTFVFINQYAVEPLPSRGGTQAAQPALMHPDSVTHVDAYRLTGVDDLDALGWDRLFDPRTRRAADSSVAFIEWPQRIAAALPDDAARVRIEATGEHERAFTLMLPHSWSSRRASEWFAERAPVRCPVTKVWVPPTAPTWPFATQRARDADMYQWFTGGYKTSRGIGANDAGDAL